MNHIIKKNHVLVFLLFVVIATVYYKSYYYTYNSIQQKYEEYIRRGGDKYYIKLADKNVVQEEEYDDTYDLLHQNNKRCIYQYFKDHVIEDEEESEEELYYFKESLENTRQQLLHNHPYHHIFRRIISPALSEYYSLLKSNIQDDKKDSTYNIVHGYFAGAMEYCLDKLSHYSSFLKSPFRFIQDVYQDFDVHRLQNNLQEEISIMKSRLVADDIIFVQNPTTKSRHVAINTLPSLTIKSDKKENLISTSSFMAKPTTMKPSLSKQKEDVISKMSSIFDPSLLSTMTPFDNFSHITTMLETLKSDLNAVKTSAPSQTANKPTITATTKEIYLIRKELGLKDIGRPFIQLTYAVVRKVLDRIFELLISMSLDPIDLISKSIVKDVNRSLRYSHSIESMPIQVFVQIIAVMIKSLFKIPVFGIKYLRIFVESMNEMIFIFCLMIAAILDIVLYLVALLHYYHEEYFISTAVGVFIYCIYMYL